MFWTVPLSINRSSFSLASSIRTDVLILLASCQQNLCDIHHCCVYSDKTPDYGQRNCPKHVEFYSKNIIIIIIIINCDWVVTRWQRLFYMHTKFEIGYY